jgi:hypothetical protein
MDFEMLSVLCFQPQGAFLSSFFDKPFATIHTIRIHLSSPDCVFLFTAQSPGDILIYNFTTRRAKAHQSV